jgi:hypothetical protein
MEMLAGGVGLFASTILKLRALSSTFYGSRRRRYRQPVVAYITASMLNSAEEKLSLGYGP